MDRPNLKRYRNEREEIQGSRIIEIARDFFIIVDPDLWKQLANYDCTPDVI